MSAYAELAVTTNYSFLRGASHAGELVKQAKTLGLAGIGIADRNSVAGVVRAHTMAKIVGQKIVVGSRLVFSDGTPDILAYPSDRAAWARLTRLLTLGKSRAEKGDCILGLPDLLEWIEGQNLIVIPPRRITSGLGDVLARLRQAASRRSVWLAVSRHYRGDDDRRISRLAKAADRALIPLIVVNDVLYHAPERRSLQDVMSCVREHVTLKTAGRRLEANAERHLKSSDEMARLFRDMPRAFGQTTRFLKRCGFSLNELGPDYPGELSGGYATPHERLRALTEEGVLRRYPGGLSEEWRKILEKEFSIIKELDCAPYFLTVHDIVRFANSKGILCQGRGSAANSLICYCLGVTAVSPERAGLLFERFLSMERKEPPDIDVDFEHERREEVIQHIFNHYGRDRTALTATVICYRSRSALRDVGKVFGLSEDAISALSGMIWGWSMEGVAEKEVRRAGLDPSDPRLKQVLKLSEELMGMPRHLSQHVGGFVISASRLDETVPIENAAMEDRTVVEWDKEDLEELKILKVDILALGMLSCLRRGLAFLKQYYGIDSGLADIPEEEKAVYDMLSRADSIGVFQVESRAQMSMLPRLKPKTFYDLVIEVAIVRPGPIQGNMVHPYLRRRMKIDEVKFPSPLPQFGPANELEAVLGRTLGIPLFQEQAMQIAIVAAGFEPSEANKLRRAMATFRRVGTIKSYRRRFVEGMTGRGYPREFAENCFNQIEGFGDYGFPESHAASFALLVYASAWIKCHYPDVFAATLLNSQPMGFYAPAQLVRDAQDHGVEVRDVDVSLSNWDCTLEHAPSPQAQLHPRHADMKTDILTTHALRLGFREIDGMSEDHGRTIESVRGRGFDSVRDLWLRTRLPPSVLERLARADAFRSLGLDRREALWAVRALQRAGDKDNLPLFARVAMPELETDVGLPPMLPGEHVIEDYRHLHLSLKAHPVSFLRGELTARGILRHEELPNIVPGRIVTVAGLVLVRQRPGEAKAIFMTLEDETGIANTIMWLRTYEAYRPVVLGARFISVTGMLQNEQNVIHVVANKVEDLTPLLQRLTEPVVRPESSALGGRVDGFRHPRDGDSLVTYLKQHVGRSDEAVDERVLPKGRNFH